MTRPPLPRLMYLEGGGVTWMSGGSKYISASSDGSSRNPSTCVFPWDIPPEIIYLGVFGHGPLEQRTATNNVLEGWVGSPQVR